MKLISTSALAKEREIDSKDLFVQLNEKGWIYKKDGQWHLTKEGRLVGGEMKYNPKYGEYVVWPSDLNLKSKPKSESTLNATSLGEHFDVSSRKINLYLSELGWMDKNQGGWVVTKEGRKNGGHQLEAMNGKPYVVWSEEILSNKHLLRSINTGEGKTEVEEVVETTQEDQDFRKKFPANIRTSDGHYVRSRAELLIDNFLYTNSIVHAYERKVNIDEEMFCDFYIPNGKVYVEFWGLVENEQYLERKKRKLELYAKYNFNLIELFDKDIENLDELFAAKLRKCNINID